MTNNGQEEIIVEDVEDTPDMVYKENIKILNTDRSKQKGDVEMGQSKRVSNDGEGEKVGKPNTGLIESKKKNGSIVDKVEEKPLEIPEEPQQNQQRIDNNMNDDDIYYDDDNNNESSKIENELRHRVTIPLIVMPEAPQHTTSPQKFDNFAKITSRKTRKDGHFSPIYAQERYQTDVHIEDDIQEKIPIRVQAFSSKKKMENQELQHQRLISDSQSRLRKKDRTIYDKLPYINSYGFDLHEDHDDLYMEYDDRKLLDEYMGRSTGEGDEAKEENHNKGTEEDPVSLAQQAYLSLYLVLSL